MESLLSEPTDTLICFYLKVNKQDVPGNIAEGIQRDRDYVGKRLKILEHTGHVHYRGNHVYRVTKLGKRFANFEKVNEIFQVNPLLCDWPEDMPVSEP